MSSANNPCSVREDTTLVHLMYALFLAFPLYGLPAVLAMVINLTQSASRINSLTASHIRWQRQSAMVAAAIYVVSRFVEPTWLSLSLLSLCAAWFAYRIAKGWLRLTDGAMAVSHAS
ncbi:hypothetical protein [Paraferrimonas sedimenticola]|uniref:Uncharacterized protein n=1 Tax=Paraferrimonas sedimenticola TaxID=375674 RepID=A0AA37RYU2_9GAMM|nr:hypothetical protein [Paraferrimonas sedimenticola]GLP97172.1 hypothetical protein GCM10007895_24790 [Paraferrimonas sedimenticola]